MCTHYASSSVSHYPLSRRRRRRFREDLRMYTNVDHLRAEFNSTCKENVNILLVVTYNIFNKDRAQLTEYQLQASTSSPRYQPVVRR